MNRILISLFSFSFSLIYCQSHDTIKFQPEWKIGTKKSIFVNETRIDYQSDTISDISYKADVIVFQVTESDSNISNILIMRYNPMYLIFKEFQLDFITNQFKDSFIEIDLVIDKNTGGYYIYNWQKIVDDVHELKYNIIKDPDQLGAFYYKAVELVFESIDEQLKNERGFNDFFLSHLDYVLLPYKYKMNLGDTIYLKDTITNPFQSKKETSTMKKLFLQNISNETIAFHIIREIEENNLKEFAKTLLTTLNKKAKSSPKQSKIDSKIYDNAKMKTIERTIIYFDKNTLWTTKAEKRVDIYYEKGEKKNVKQLNIDINIKGSATN